MAPPYPGGVGDGKESLPPSEGLGGNGYVHAPCPGCLTKLQNGGRYRLLDWY